MKAREVERILKKWNVPSEVRAIIFGMQEEIVMTKQEINDMAKALDATTRVLNQMSFVMGAHQEVIASSHDAGMRATIEKRRAPAVTSEPVGNDYDS